MGLELNEKSGNVRQKTKFMNIRLKVLIACLTVGLVSVNQPSSLNASEMHFAGAESMMT